MRSVFFFLLLGFVFPAYSAQIYLRPKPNLPGHDAQNGQVRMHDLTGTGEFWVQVMVAEFTEPISAAQIAVEYPAHWIRVEGPAPLRRGDEVPSEHVVFLPSTPDGMYQPDLVDNGEGQWRALMVIGDFQSHLQPTTEPQVLFEMRFTAVGVTVPECASARGEIVIRPPSMDPLHGSMVLNHRAEPLSLDLSRNQPVTLVQENTLQKGNLTRYLPGGVDDLIDYDDLAVLYRCLATSQRGCGLSGITEQQYRQLTDLDCSGGDPDHTDLRVLLEVIERRAMKREKRSDAQVLVPENGMFQLVIAPASGGLVIHLPDQEENSLGFVVAAKNSPHWDTVVVKEHRRSPLLLLLPKPGNPLESTLLTWPALTNQVLPITLTTLRPALLAASPQE
ncbi:hypothetical protein [Acanthopleuribacter pedis]|uniref:Uncharacterized protein n=1 Tax=Acanthopleuribacter pedis TaxID=442870 RepID=A0A8J7QEK3_9BACT|nr:hypothetical protein [Acanthopleuribacter pedis]MBO1318275.1 hypothetical protein [Acanthopleuribacter pedis]